MVYQPVEGLLPKANYSAYKLVTMAGKRAQELAAGAPRLVEASAIEKVTTTALREILAGKVMLKEVADALVHVAKGKKAK